MQTHQPLQGSWTDETSSRLAPARGGSQMASVEEQLSWLRDTGFGPAECIRKDVRLALFCGLKWEVRIPAAQR
jgi:hypothetical protein